MLGLALTACSTASSSGAKTPAPSAAINTPASPPEAPTATPAPLTQAADAVTIDTTALTVAPNGDVYIANSYLPSACFIYRLRGDTLETVAGKGPCGFGGDGGPALDAEFYEVNGLAVDAAGDLFLSDSGNCRIREVTGGVIKTIAGNGTCGYMGDAGPATDAELGSPFPAGPGAIALDAQGDLFISDGENCRVRRVRAGIITTVAGSGACEQPGTGDGGPATHAGIQPEDLAVAPDGTLYVVDAPNFRQQHAGGGACTVRAVRGRVIETVAGNGCGTTSLGDGIRATSASLFLPSGIAVDGLGNLYIADGFCRVRVVRAGVITTIAGKAWDPLKVHNSDDACTYDGATGPALRAQIRPGAIAVAPDGSVYVADGDACRILRIAHGVIAPFAGNGCPR